MPNKSPSKYAGKKIVVRTDTFSWGFFNNAVEAHTASHKGYGGSVVQEFELHGKCVRPDDDFITTTHSDGHKSVLIYCNRKMCPSGRLKVVYQSVT